MAHSERRVALRYLNPHHHESNALSPSDGKLERVSTAARWQVEAEAVLVEIGDEIVGERRDRYCRPSDASALPITRSSVSINDRFRSSDRPCSASALTSAITERITGSRLRARAVR